MTEKPTPSPPAGEQPRQTPEEPSQQAELPPVTAERNQDYHCTEDGSLARILDPVSEREQIFSAKEVDAPAVISARPKPGYTREARSNGIQGVVILRVVLSSAGKISRVRVMRRLPFGLTENAIRSACKIEFKPARKYSQPVSQWLPLEYAFRLADSSIFGP